MGEADDSPRSDAAQGHALGAVFLAFSLDIISSASRQIDSSGAVEDSVFNPVGAFKG